MTDTILDNVTDSTPDVVQDVTPETAPSLLKEDLILGKFKTQDDLVKSYQELSKKLGANVGAPADGYKFEKELPLPEFSNKMLETMKELNISQESAERLLNTVFEFDKATQERLQQEAQIQTEARKSEEYAKLGENASERIKTLTAWVSNSFTESEQNMIKSFCTTADAIKLVEGLKDKLTKINMQSQPQIDANDYTQQDNIAKAQAMLLNRDTHDRGLEMLRGLGVI